MQDKANRIKIADTSKMILNIMYGALAIYVLQMFLGTEFTMGVLALVLLSMVILNGDKIAERWKK